MSNIQLPGPELGPNDLLPCGVSCDGGLSFNKNEKIAALLDYLARRVTHNNNGLEITLRRCAELSASIARRLYLLRNWTPEETAQHAADLREREAILCAASQDYADVLTEARERGLLDEPAPQEGGRLEP